jgi:hypothetical protein
MQAKSHAQFDEIQSTVVLISGIGMTQMWMSMDIPISSSGILQVKITS